MHNRRVSPWHIPLVRELALILVVKLALLLLIKHIWFNAPTVPVAGTELTAAHLLNQSIPAPLPTLEETPR